MNQSTDFIVHLHHRLDISRVEAEALLAAWMREVFDMRRRAIADHAGNHESSDSFYSSTNSSGHRKGRRS